MRKLPERAARVEATLPLQPAPQPSPVPRPPPQSDAASAREADAHAEDAPSPRPVRASVRPVSAEGYSLNVTLDASFKAELDELRALLGHKVPNGDLAAVLRIAVRCAVEKYGKRKGAKPVRQVASAAAQEPPKRLRGVDRHPGSRPAIPAAVRRAVWARGGGQMHLARAPRPALPGDDPAGIRPHPAGGAGRSLHRRQPPARLHHP